MRPRPASRFLLLVVALLFAACAKQPVRDEVTIEFDNKGATVYVSTNFDLNPPPELRGRVETARMLALAGTDAWSVRIGRMDPLTERTIFDRRAGVLEQVTRVARVDPRNLQPFFADVAVTATLTDGEGWRELAFYPGTSTRATREQQRRFDERLDEWSRAVARYMTAVHHLYAYLDANPQRARYVFAALFDVKGADGAPPAVLEDEEPLVEAVDRAVEALLERAAAEEKGALDLAEEADLIFNPFPARITVKVPGTILATEGFSKDLTIERIDLADAMANLEGRWIAPDPVAMLLREETIDVAAIARMERKSSPVVVASELNAALREQFARPKQYVVRWRG